MRNILSLAAALLVTASPAFAQDNATSYPAAAALDDATPLPLDQAYPGVMQLHVDATDVERRIFRVKQTIPVMRAGEMTLLYPEWLPGKHSPRGAVSELAGLVIRANGKTLHWERDPLDVYAFKIDVPEGVSQLDIEFQFVSPLEGNEGRIVVTPAMMNVQWEQVSLYPAGYYTRRIQVQPTIDLPAGWTGVAALDGGTTSQSDAANTVSYGVTDYETLIDSPMFAGPHYRRFDLGQDVALNVWADEAKFLEAEPAQIAAHRRLVDETVALFGSKHFDRYEFLLGLTDQLGGIGLEHHRSSENTRAQDYFTDYDNNGWERGLLPHELIHSWNGKFRRPEGLWTPDYRTPMQDNLLWVYEGQTSYWDLILGVRSGLQSKEIALGEWARAVAGYTLEPGREWRSVEDTTHDPIIAARKAKPFDSWQRSEDYYVEGSLVWLEADMIIRERTGGRKSLDDFARAFFGIRNGDRGTVTYDFDEVAAALNAVTPFDWSNFLTQRLRRSGQPAPIAGFTKGRYALVYREEPNAYEKQVEAAGKSLDLRHSLGMGVGGDGDVGNIIWDGIAFRNGIVDGTTIVAVNGMEYSRERMKDAITAAKDSGTIALLLKRGGRYRTAEIAYDGGLRYPHLEKTGSGETAIDRLLEPLTETK